MFSLALGIGANSTIFSVLNAVLFHPLPVDQPDRLMMIWETERVIETPSEVCNRVLEAAEYLPVSQLGTTDDCGFSPFADDTSTSRDIAFEKIRSRVLGTALAAKELGHV